MVHERFFNVSYFSPVFKFQFLLYVYSGEFDDVLDNSIPTPVSSHEQNISILFTNSSSWESNGSVFVNNKLLEIENLTLQTPKSKRVLIDELSFVLDHRDHLLVSHIICVIHVKLDLTIWFVAV